MNGSVTRGPCAPENFLFRSAEKPTGLQLMNALAADEVLNTSFSMQKVDVFLAEKREAALD